MALHRNVKRKEAPGSANRSSCVVGSTAGESLAKVALWTRRWTWSRDRLTSEVDIMRRWFVRSQTVATVMCLSGEDVT